MRFLVLACAMVAQSVCALHAQSVSDVLPPNQRQHDFGAVPKASKAEHRFVLHNPFSSDLIVQSVRTSCGCTTPTIIDKVIKPGETGAVLAKFNTDRFTGEKKATVTVTLSQPQYTEIQLNVRGYIRSDIVLQPYEAAFGSVPEGAGAKLALELNYLGRADWTIQEITCPFSFLKANFEVVSREGQKVRYAIEVLLDGSAPEGYFENQLVIHTNDNRLKTFPIHVSGKVDKPLQTAPTSLALGPVKPNEPITKRVTLTSKSEFSILDISSEVAEIRFQAPTRPSRAHMLQLTIAPKVKNALDSDALLDREVTGKIVIKTDLSDCAAEIPLSFSIETDKLAEISGGVP